MTALARGLFGAAVPFPLTNAINGALSRSLRRRGAVSPKEAVMLKIYFTYSRPLRRRGAVSPKRDRVRFCSLAASSAPRLLVSSPATF